ncbi:T9SS type A sorting domain-containing protein [candidate division WOR-3 bacterium]|nr:T9SS type A sorting domain-containing protein [candidate division WOR-3 bacterium]
MKSILFCCIILLMVSVLYCKDIEVPFNVADVIKQATEHSKFENAQVDYRWDSKGFHFPGSRFGEFLIDTNVVYVPGHTNQSFPSVAFDGTNYLVVWMDYRCASNDIYGTRVNQSGVVLDPAGIAISTDGFSQHYPSVAFNGANYLVVWEDLRNFSTDIYGARVTQSGIVLDPDGIAISTVTNWQESPSVACDGTNYLVVWEDWRSGSHPPDIYGARVNQSGVVLDPDGIGISTSTTAYGQYSPSVAFDGANYFVVWEHGSNRDIYGTRVNQSGVVLDPDGIAISTALNNQSYPSVGFDGTNYLVVWHDYRSGSNSDIYGARVDQSGVVLDPDGIAISTSENNQESPSVSFDGTNYLVVWNDYHSGLFPDIYGTRVNQSGVVLDPDGIDISIDTNSQYSPSVACDGTNYLVVWHDYRSGLYPDIYSTRVNQSGVVLDTAAIVISTTGNEQHSPSVAFDGTNYLVVWHDCRSGLYPDIYGTRVNQSGVFLDPIGIAISTDTNSQASPSVAFDGINYLVVWEDSRSGPYSDIYGALVNQSGIVLDPDGIAISTYTDEQFSPSVAFDGTNYLVVWMDNRNGSYSDIYGARVNQLGTVLDPDGIAISTATYWQESPSAAFDGTNYMVVWHDGSLPDIYGARVNQSGIVLDPDGIAISTALNNQSYPSVAFDGTNYMVVWQDTRNGYPDIYSARVNQSGVVLDPDGIAISTGSYYQKYPSVAFDGTNYLIVWQDSRNSPFYDIYGAILSTSMVVIDSFDVSLQSGEQLSPALAHGQGEQLLITYSGWTEEVGGKVYNTTRIWGKFNGFIGPQIFISPSSFNITLKPDESRIEPLTISNSGDEILTWSISESPPVDWLLEDTTSGSINPGDSTSVNITFDASDISQGDYYDTLVVSSNDTNNPTINVPIQLSVIISDTIIGDTITVYPNPFKPKRGHNTLTFTNLPDEGTIEVFTISGNSVWKHSFAHIGKFYSWDTKNENGKNVTSGVYFYLIKDGTGKVLKKSKFAIIR